MFETSNKNEGSISWLIRAIIAALRSLLLSGLIGSFTGTRREPYHIKEEMSKEKVSCDRVRPKTPGVSRLEKCKDLLVLILGIILLALFCLLGLSPPRVFVAGYSTS